MDWDQGQSVKPSNCSCLHSTPIISKHSTIPVPDSLHLRRKVSFTFHFDTSLSSLMMWNLQSYPTTVSNKRMWHFRGSKHTLDSYILHSGDQDLSIPRIYAHDQKHSELTANFSRGSQAYNSQSCTYLSVLKNSVRIFTASHSVQWRSAVIELETSSTIIALWSVG